ncbi:LTA synthase family protein [Cellulophaga lytica]|nr:LTA synthase family protein [Cellulophaga lytica]
MSVTVPHTSTDLTLKHYTRLLISFALVLVILSLYQYIVLFNKGIINTIFSVSYLLSITHHIGFAAFVGFLLVIPYYFLEKSKYGRGYKFTFFVLFVLLATECFLILYFTRANVPLGANILDYNYVDFKSAITTNIVVPFLFILLVTILIFLFYGTYLITSKYYHYVNKMFPFTFFLLTIFVASLFVSGQPINQNKTQFLIVNLYQNFLEDDTYLDNPNNPPYPLLNDYKINNTFNNHFNLLASKPNIVFVMVNGLGADFIDKNSKYGNFMPFLDSLAQKSLYWQNCFATTGKQFGALPAVVGSLPHGKKGFMEVTQQVNRATLFSILKNNGYSTAYLQGSNSSFNNVDNFVYHEKVDLLIDRSYFGLNYKLTPVNSSGQSLGYPDKELFKKSLNTPRNAHKPKFDVYTTASLQEPFIIPNNTVYLKNVKSIIKSSKASKTIKNQLNKSKEILACMLYTDTSLKYFFQSYKNKKEYQNTIFVITGTHRLVNLPATNALKKYNVPLLVFSPMLKAPKTLKAVTSHLDIVPSFINLLADGYNISVPKKVAWLGNNLPFSSNFLANRNIAIMRDKNQIEDFLHNNHFYSSGTIYKVDDKLNLIQSTNDSVYNLLVNYRSINSYVTRYNKLIPAHTAIFKIENTQFSEEDKIWINSVLNGQSFDSAYKTAQKMAFNRDTENALRLCNYILYEIPSHIDAKILKGRINSWNKNYDVAEQILLKCISSNPTYDDSYSALLDVYFWSNQNIKSIDLESIMLKNGVNTPNLSIKLKRAHTELKK